ncbi:hypothetical protein WJ0W_000524 [Paenibacillus melissococcoides]|uniref:Uncharacterized protein n=1 Tax=Paenibacillus melissococcoides TaxID=2912268 RepID=A0ABN8U195_9BACL|nr:hypothetical protein WJ0W_000524 [Paenibacillus melissococcoides]
MQEFHQIAAERAEIDASAQHFTASSIFDRFARRRFSRIHILCYLVISIILQCL